MSSINRRDFLKSSLAGTAVLAALAAEVQAADADAKKKEEQKGDKKEKKEKKKGGKKGGGRIALGAQSYSFRNFKFEDSIKQLKALGLEHMEFCSVHFPPKVDDPGFAKVKETIKAEGIKVPCFGVESFTADDAANRAKFEFAKALGIGILTADPEPDSFDSLDKLVQEFNIKIAIHNHGPKSRYDKAEDILKAIEKYHSNIGACVDTGHSIRSGEKPADVIMALGKRIHCLHLKDWKQGGEEQILGQGDMDMEAIARALKGIGFKGPIMMEYENSPDNPVPDMQKGLDNWKKVWAAKKEEDLTPKEAQEQFKKDAAKAAVENASKESK